VVKKKKNTFDKVDLRLLQLRFSKLCVENRQGKAHHQKVVDSKIRQETLKAHTITC